MHPLTSEAERERERETQVRERESTRGRARESERMREQEKRTDSIIGHGGVVRTFLPPFLDDNETPRRFRLVSPGTE
jgi:hypothetical protein